MKRIQLINGPNLNLLGKREPEIYGYTTFGSWLEGITPLFPDLELSYFQSNHEGALIDKIHEVGFDFDGIIINAGAYSHTSIAIADALRAVKCPALEVHLSNIFARESFRHHSYLSEVCVGQIVGLGLKGYELALNYF